MRNNKNLRLKADKLYEVREEDSFDYDEGMETERDELENFMN